MSELMSILFEPISWVIDRTLDKPVMHLWAWLCLMTFVMSIPAMIVAVVLGGFDYAQDYMGTGAFTSLVTFFVVGLFLQRRRVNRGDHSRRGRA